MGVKGTTRMDKETTPTQTSTQPQPPPHPPNSNSNLPSILTQVVPQLATNHPRQPFLHFHLFLNPPMICLGVSSTPCISGISWMISSHHSSPTHSRRSKLLSGPQMIILSAHWVPMGHYWSPSGTVRSLNCNSTNHSTQTPRTSHTMQILHHKQQHHPPPHPTTVPRPHPQNLRHQTSMVDSWVAVAVVGAGVQSK